MEKNWSKIKLSDCCEFQEGYVNPSQKNEEYFDGDVKWVRAVDLNNGYVYDTSRKLSQKGFESAKKSAILFEPDTIVISKSGTIGKLGIIKDYMCGNRATINIKPKDNVDMQYLFYALRNLQKILPGLAVGSVQKNLYVSILQDLEIPFPSMDEQIAIADFIAAFDDKIDVNNKMNKNLEKQCKSIFDSWFVKYDGFDEPLIESPIGTRVPQSLKMIRIGSLPHVLETGKRPKGGAVDKGIPSVGAESVKGLGDFDPASTKFIPEEFAATLKKGKIEGYELLLYKDGGKPGVFTPHCSMFGEGYPFDNFFINEHVFKLDFGDRGLNEFAYFYFQTDYVVNWLAANGGKAAIPGINQNDVREIWIYDFEHPMVRKFCGIVQPYFTEILKNLRQNLRIAEVRDMLLSKIYDGKISVYD